MNTKYVPILKWKAGEKRCLEKLASNVSEEILPFVEILLPTAENEMVMEKKYNKLTESFNLVWVDKPFYLYLSDEWYDDIDSTEQIYEIYEKFYTTVNHPKAIPAFDIEDAINISTVADYANTNRICLRVTVKDFETLDNMLSAYIDKSWISPQNTDLLIDLGYIDKEIYPTKAALTTVLSDIPNISDYRSVIIASCSFPKDISRLQPDIVNEINRNEANIHNIALKLREIFSFNYIYADYGPVNLDDVGYIPGMLPSFKIRYSTNDKYLVVKGLSIKKGGLDIQNVRASCKKIMDHPGYSGEDFSNGDKVIADTANGQNIKGGNLTNWIEYSFNHHITLIDSLL